MPMRDPEPHRPPSYRRAAQDERTGNRYNRWDVSAEARRPDDVVPAAHRGEDHPSGAAGNGPLVVERHGDEVRVVPDEELAAQRTHRRYGGLDVAASLAGMLAAVGLAVVLAGILAGAGTVGYQLDVQRDEQALSVGGFVAGLVVLVLSFLVGGWVAGRMARYDGGRNGVLAAVWFLVLTAVLAGIGAWLGQDYQVFTRIDMPRWFDDNTTTVAGVISAVVAVALSLVAGFLGGLVGAGYHRRVDRGLTDTEAARQELARRAVVEG